jgi:hypothetical protein
VDNYKQWIIQIPYLLYYKTSFFLILKHLQRLVQGRAIAQAVSRWLPTAAVRGSKPDIGMWDFVMDKSGAGFLRELRFPLPIYIPSALHVMPQRHSPARSVRM